MKMEIFLFAISLLFFFVGAEKSNYNNFQNREPVKMVYGNGINTTNCFITSLPTNFPKVDSEGNIKFYKTLYITGFDFCNTTNVDLNGYQSVIITPSDRCGMIQQKANARAFNISILMYVVQSHMSLPNYPSELSKEPAVVLIPVKDFNSRIYFWNNSKVGIYKISTNIMLSRFSEMIIFSLVVVTMLVTMGITVGFTRDILDSEEEKTNDPPGTPSSVNSSQGCQLRYMSIILPIFMVVILLLLYFFYFIMVWIMIMSFYLLSAYCLSMVVMLFIRKFDLAPNLKKPFNKWGFHSIDYRYLSVFALGLIISTVWVVLRKNTVGLILNNVMGVYVCISVAISLGAMFVIGRSFKILLLIMVIFMVLDAVMVYVPVGNKMPDVSQQLPLFGSWDQIVRVKRSNGNSIMENVATAMSGSSSEEIPIRFKIPHLPTDWSDSNRTCQVVTGQFSLIGFGDLILPGAFIVFMMTFAVIAKSNVLLYFLVTFVGYTVGLVLTYVTLVMTSSGQPALVFLQPCTIVPTLLLALARNELMSLWYHDWMPQRLEESHEEDKQTAEDHL